MWIRIHSPDGCYKVLFYNYLLKHTVPVPTYCFFDKRRERIIAPPSFVHLYFAGSRNLYCGWEAGGPRGLGLALPLRDLHQERADRLAGGSNQSAQHRRQDHRRWGRGSTLCVA